MIKLTTNPIKLTTIDPNPAIPMQGPGASVAGWFYLARKSGCDDEIPWVTNG
jgi:hypothetical protein